MAGRHNGTGVDQVACPRQGGKWLGRPPYGAVDRLGSGWRRSWAGPARGVWGVSASPFCGNARQKKPCRTIRKRRRLGQGAGASELKNFDPIFMNDPSKG